MSDDIPQDQVEAVARALLAKDWEKSGVDESLPPEIWKAYVPDAIAAIRVLTPMIAAVERERCAKIAENCPLESGRGNTRKSRLSYQAIQFQVANYIRSVKGAVT